MADENKKFTRETLINSTYFSQYNRFFLAAVLTEPEYTLRQAEKTVKKFMNSRINLNIKE